MTGSPAAPFVIGIVGRSGAGKTTLIERLIPALRSRGLSVSTIKHTHHAIELDTPGKDSHRHRMAGATEVILATPHHFTLVATHGDADEPPLEVLLARLAPVDLVLVEGFKRDPVPKIEIRRGDGGTPPLWPSDRDIIAVATDGPPAGCDRTVLPLADVEAIADFVVAARRAAQRAAAPLRAVEG